MMIQVTTEQFTRELSNLLGFVSQGETVAISDQGRIVAHLTPPDDATPPLPVAPSSSMTEWLDLQDHRMQRTFGNRIVADSAAVLDDQRGDH